MSARVQTSKSLRFEVFKRDGFTCQYCGATPPKVLLHADHIHPVAEGGTTDIDNLVTACEACNQGKGARLLSSIPIGLADKAALVAEKEEQIAGYEAIMRGKRERLDENAWQAAEAWMELYSRDSILKTDLRSIRVFVERLGFDAVVEAMSVAARKMPYSHTRGFKYFCGVCWKVIRDNEVSA